MDAIDKILYETFITAFRTKSINVNGVLSIITFSMITIDKFKKLHGREKLERVIHLLKEILKTDIGLPKDVVVALSDMLAHDHIIIGVIENILEATKNINVHSSSCFVCK